MDPLEFYVETGLVSPATKLLQMQKLLRLQEIRGTFSRKDCRGIGLSQAYKLQGVNSSFSEYLRSNGADKPTRVKGGWHKFAWKIQDSALKNTQSKGLSDYGCIHLRLGDFADYCKLRPATWTYDFGRRRNRRNQSITRSQDDCFVSDATV